MLAYYILSGGHHPFGEDFECEFNIYYGKYSLEHVRDVIAKNLIEWMINKDPKGRPTVKQCLAHPFFWSRLRYYVLIIYMNRHLIQIQRLIAEVFFNFCCECLNVNPLSEK